MVTYLRKGINDVIHKNKQFTLTYLNENGENKVLKTEKELLQLCMALMSEKELLKNEIVERYSFDIDNVCRYVWGFNTKKALFAIINSVEHFGITILQATYDKQQIYSYMNENIKLEEFENVKKQRDVYKQQVDIQKEIIKIYQEDDEEEDLEV